MWTVKISTLFKQWLDQQDEDLRATVLFYLELIEEDGPHLKRPQADSVKGSKITNLKELRIQHRGDPYRAFFVFDPERCAVVLCAGSKKGVNEKEFYREMIKISETEYANYLQESPNVSDT